jgi:hypothetical protein
VTFAEQSDGEVSGRRERSSARERARDIEERLGKDEREDEEAVMGSSVMSKGSEGGHSVGSEEGKDSTEKSCGSAMGSSTEAIED